MIKNFYIDIILFNDFIVLKYFTNFIITLPLFY